MSPKTFKNIDYFESYLKFNETASFWTHFIENFNGIKFIEKTNFIDHRIKIKII